MTTCLLGSPSSNHIHWEFRFWSPRSDQTAGGERLQQDIGSGVDLLARFKQLAVDQASEQSRQFHPREVADNLLTAMRPILTWADGEVDNAIPAGLEMTGCPGLLAQLLQHLLAGAMNRAERSSQPARIQLTAKLGNDEHGEWVLLSLLDHSPLLDEPRAGLARAEVLIRDEYQGTLDVSVTDQGTQVSARLPRSMG